MVAGRRASAARPYFLCVKRLPLLAQMRSADRVQKCLLFGIDRTYRRHVLNDVMTHSGHHAFDYSITASARARIDGGFARPRAFAVFMLIASSKGVGFRPTDRSCLLNY